MKFELILAAIALSLAAAPLARAQAALDIVKDGKSPYVIVMRENATPSERRGAEELQKHFEQMTGVFIPVVTDSSPAQDHEIVVGLSRRSDEAHLAPNRQALGNEGFQLKTIGQKLFILGSNVRGAMYGCYDVLEKLGVRWYTPKVTKVPQNKFVTLPALDEMQTPAFEYREPFFTEAFEKNWAARNRCNGSNQLLDESTGGKVMYASPFVHSFDVLVPRTLYKEHPEYFPFREGKRKDGYVQRCLSNPDVLKITVENVKKLIAEQPQAVIFSVSQNDCGEWCECDACNKIAKKYGGQTGLYVWFVNQVAEQIQKEHPDKLIDTLAYQFTEAAPKGIRPRHNVRIRLCPIACCNAHPYEKCSHPANKAYLERLTAWSKLTNTLYIWHYNTDFGHYLMPFPNFNEFPADTKLYKESGVKGIFFQGDYAPGGGGSDAELRSWVMAKLLWNETADTESLVSEWMQGVYGPAAQPMRRWYELVHAPFADPDQHLGIYDAPKIEIFTPELMKMGAAMFDEADKLAQTDLQKEYLKRARLSWRYVDLVHYPNVEKLTKFIADCKSFGITQLNEGRNIDQWDKDIRANLRK